MVPGNMGSMLTPAATLCVFLFKGIIGALVSTKVMSVRGLFGGGEQHVLIQQTLPM